MVSYWTELLSLTPPDQTGLIIITGLENCPGRDTLSISYQAYLFESR